MIQYLGTPEHMSPLLFLFVMMSKINDARDTQRREELLKVKVRVVVLFFRAMYELCPSLCRMQKNISRPFSEQQSYGAEGYSLRFI